MPIEQAADFALDAIRNMGKAVENAWPILPRETREEIRDELLAIARRLPFGE